MTGRRPWASNIHAFRRTMKQGEIDFSASINPWGLREWLQVLSGPVEDLGHYPDPTADRQSIAARRVSRLLHRPRQRLTELLYLLLRSALPAVLFPPGLYRLCPGRKACRQAGGNCRNGRTGRFSP
jgi:histidinol-phosphate/aromatic aminotransferase/cobyric acid decarboxylase-like protein